MMMIMRMITWQIQLQRVCVVYTHFLQLAIYDRYCDVI